MEKIVEVKYPMITSWQWHASIFSLLDQDERALNWIYSNYIQLGSTVVETAGTNENFYFVDFIPGNESLHQCPYILSQRITKEQILSYSGDILDFTLKSLDMSYCVFAVMDQTKMFNFPDRVLHELFVYGYDLDRRVFYVADFSFHDNYSYAEVTFEDYVEGFMAVKDEEDYTLGKYLQNTRGVILLKKNTERFDYKIDISYITELLKEYLTSYPTPMHFRDNQNYDGMGVYGISIYDELIHEMEKIIQTSIPKFDVRPLHIMYDHKVLMYNRLKYLMEKGYLEVSESLLDYYNQVVKLLLKARNVYMKEEVRQRIDRLDKVISFLLEAKEKEIEVLQKVIIQLETRGGKK